MPTQLLRAAAQKAVPRTITSALRSRPRTLPRTATRQLSFPTAKDIGVPTGMFSGSAAQWGVALKNSVSPVALFLPMTGAVLFWWWPVANGMMLISTGGTSGF
ncbi:hypothetical protein PG995_009088 [Apiospora arundinis]